jgi:two-component system nitrogen regulation response regulator GlnG
MKEVSGTILIADDDSEIVNMLGCVLSRKGLTPVLAGGAREALHLIETVQPDVLLVDFRMPEMDGMEVMRKAKEIDPDLPAILITAYADIQGAVEAIRAGAHDYLGKPFDHHDVIRVVLRALNERRRKVTWNPSKPPSKPPSMPTSKTAGGNAALREIFGPSDAIGKVIASIELVAKLNFSVIILGETGSGKEVVAQAIHRESMRPEGPFVAVDCGAIPDLLIESELFGHERGAFTGADQQMAGKLETARGGTLFLDEIANLSLGAQAKFLRVLQERTLQRLGGGKSIGVDIRVLAAGNRDIEDLCGKGAFRSDLYFRLNDFTISLPPLRQRREDIPFLAGRFLETTNVELGKNVQGFSAGASDAMLAYEWPGNVRQLRSVVRRAVLMSDDIVAEKHLCLKQAGADPSLLNVETGLTMGAGGDWEGQPLREVLRRSAASLERKVIVQALRGSGGNKAKAARLLHVDYKTIHTKVKEYGIDFEQGKTGNQTHD